MAVATAVALISCILINAYFNFVGADESYDDDMSEDPQTEERYTCRENFVKINSTCYLFVTERSSWSDARSSCSKIGARLAELKSDEKNNGVFEYIQKNYGSRYAWWIGGTDVYGSRGYWIWASMKSPIIWSNWCEGEPDHKYNHRCLLLTNVDKKCWHDWNCSRLNIHTKRIHHICEDRMIY